MHLEKSAKALVVQLYQSLAQSMPPMAHSGSAVLVQEAMAVSKSRKHALLQRLIGLKRYKNRLNQKVMDQIAYVFTVRT